MTNEGEEERPSTAFAASSFKTHDELISRPATSGSNGFLSIDDMMFDRDSKYNADDDAGVTDDVAMDGGGEDDGNNANNAVENLMFFSSTATEGADNNGGVGGFLGVDAMMMGPSQEFGASPVFAGVFDGFGELGSGGEVEQQQQPVVAENILGE